MAQKTAKRIIKSSLGRFDLALLDLKKNNNLGVFLPGHLRTVLAKLKINCVIDVGANVGGYGAMLRRFGYDGRIISLEPVADVFHQLQTRAADDESWRTLNIGCGSLNEMKAMNIFHESVHSSLLAPSGNMKTTISTTYIERSEQVEVKRLDSIFDELVEGISEPRVFVKIDTQGFDLEVAKGSSGCMHRIDGLQSELSVIPLYEGSPDYLKVLGVYRDLGFEPTGFFPILNSPATQHLVEFDAVLTRRTPQFNDFVAVGIEAGLAISQEG